jgi:hypothetical protein
MASAMSYRFLGLLVFLLILVITPLSFSQAPSYFPLSVGNKWVYDVVGSIPDSSHAVFNVEIVSTQRVARVGVGSVECYVIQYQLQGQIVQEECFAWGGSSLLLYRTVVDGETFEIDPPRLYLKTPLSVGQEWKWAGEVRGQNGERSEVVLFSRVDYQADITIPAGVFKAFEVNVHATPYSELSATTWYAEGVGVVREITSYNGLTVTVNLVSFSIPDSLPHNQQPWIVPGVVLIGIAIIGLLILAIKKGASYLDPTPRQQRVMADVTQEDTPDEPLCEHGASLNEYCLRCESDVDDSDFYCEEPLCQHDVPMNEYCRFCEETCPECQGKRCKEMGK